MLVDDNIECRATEFIGRLAARVGNLDPDFLEHLNRKRMNCPVG